MVLPFAERASKIMAAVLTEQSSLCVAHIVAINKISQLQLGLSRWDKQFL